ncbi:4'-phosphopantetheinyl transferase family protein [Lutispora sp.]|uniref:4'-phosphopantetheinyl transferase family protein n=1 Tax=Lutispora sp. TaxID=2828727 RepID=UPI0035642B9D
MIEIYSIKIDGKIDSQKFKHLMQYVDKDKQVSIKTFHKIEDSQRALAAAVLVRVIAMRRLGIDNCEIQFSTNEYGKPFVKGFPDFYFNISHSGEWVVCAVDDKPIGIDIEQIQHVDLSLADRFFSRQEVLDIHSKPIDEQHSYFYDIWTLKESYIKAWGKGLSVPLDSFSLRLYDNRRIELKTCNSFKECFFKQFNIDHRYKLSVCALKNRFPSWVSNKSIDSILHFLENEKKGGETMLWY